MGKKENRIYIDADVVLHSCCHSTQYLIDWDNAGPAEVAQIYEALDAADALIGNIKTSTCSTECVLVFSPEGGRYFRHSLFPEYKANRKCNPSPLLKDRLRAELQSKYPSVCIEELEADDVLAAAKTAGYKVATVDKDLKQVPGKHYSWYHRCWVHSTEAEAMRWFYTQVLAGDQSDGYKGCPGVGIKKAEAALKACNTDSECWFAVLQCYAKAYGNAEVARTAALLNARLAWLLRSTQKPIKLWEPPEA